MVIEFEFIVGWFSFFFKVGGLDDNKYILFSWVDCLGGGFFFVIDFFCLF